MPSKTRKQKSRSLVRIPISKDGELSKYGYKDIVHTPEKKRRESLIKFMKSVGKDKSTRMNKTRKIIRKLNALAIVQKNTNPELSRRVRRDQQFMSRQLDSMKE
jgi:hypothetical protein